MKFFHHKDLGNHLLQLCPKVVKHPVYIYSTLRRVHLSRSQWPRGLRYYGFEPHREIWMFIICEYCVLSGRGLCDELITRPEESYRLWFVVVCDLETS